MIVFRILGVLLGVLVVTVVCAGIIRAILFFAGF